MDGVCPQGSGVWTGSVRRGLGCGRGLSTGVWGVDGVCLQGSGVWTGSVHRGLGRGRSLSTGVCGVDGVCRQGPGVWTESVRRGPGRGRGLSTVVWTVWMVFVHQVGGADRGWSTSVVRFNMIPSIDIKTYLLFYFT